MTWLVGLLALWPGQRANAHEIPAFVLLRLYVVVDSSEVKILARAPLAAMRDVDFPLRDSARYLDVAQSGTLARQSATTWILHSLSVHEGSAVLPGQVGRVRISLPSDRNFGSVTSARRHLADTSVITADLPWQQALLDVELTYPRRSGEAVAVEPLLARLGVRTTTVLTFVFPNGTERSLEYVGDPGRVTADPRWWMAFSRFAKLGFEHILDGIDHLLFVFCLVIPFRRLKPLIGVVTAFTVAHSITLAASALGLAPDGLWFPPLVEALIAASILYMALENIVGAKLERRWIVAFGFGLIHGFGFSFALRESLQFAGKHLATSLLAFNVGVELGQILVLVLAIPLLTLLFQRVVKERMGTIILSAFIAHTAWDWLVDRWGAFRQYPVGSSAVIGLARLVLLGTMLVLLASLATRLVGLVRAPRTIRSLPES